LGLGVTKEAVRVEDLLVVEIFYGLGVLFEQFILILLVSLSEEDFFFRLGSTLFLIEIQIVPDIVG